MFNNEYDIIFYYKNNYSDNIYKNGIYKMWFIDKPDYFYIGMASGINKFKCQSGFYNRWKRHLNDFKNNKHRNTFMQNLYNKYTFKNLRFEILEFCSKEYCIENELKWFELLKPLTNFQGNKSFKKKECLPSGIKNRKIRKNFKHSDETKLKISISNKNNKNGKKIIPISELNNIIFDINNGETFNFVIKKYKHERNHIFNVLIDYIGKDKLSLLKDKSYKNGRNKIKNSLNENKKTLSEKYQNKIENIIDLYRNRNTLEQISKIVNINSDYISLIIKENMCEDEIKKIKSENYNRYGNIQRNKR